MNCSTKFKISFDKVSKITSQNGKTEKISKHDDYCIEKVHLIYHERNLIKKVKTYCLNYFLFLVQNCVLTKHHFNLYNIKNKKKRQIFRIFKSDISKNRNFILLEIPMKIILDKISNIPWEKVIVMPGKINFFKYLMNMTWKDVILYCKRNAGEININSKRSNDSFDDILGYNKSTSQIENQEVQEANDKFKKNKFLERSMSSKNFNEYLSYIQQSDYQYGNRVNLDKGYLIAFDGLNQEVDSHKFECEISNENIFYFIFPSSPNDNFIEFEKIPEI